MHNLPGRPEVSQQFAQVWLHVRIGNEPFPAVRNASQGHEEEERFVGRPLVATLVGPDLASRLRRSSGVIAHNLSSSQRPAEAVERFPCLPKRGLGEKTPVHGVQRAPTLRGHRHRLGSVRGVRVARLPNHGGLALRTNERQRHVAVAALHAVRGEVPPVQREHPVNPRNAPPR